jgi:hypothetical protein
MKEKDFLLFLFIDLLAGKSSIIERYLSGEFEEQKSISNFKIISMDFKKVTWFLYIY